MLPSQQELARTKAHERQQLICLTVETQRLEVRQARFNFLKAALLRDHMVIETIKEVPEKAKQLEHVKQVRQRTEQAQRGEEAVQAYVAKFLSVVYIDKPELSQEKITTATANVVMSLVNCMLSGGMAGTVKQAEH